MRVLRMIDHFLLITDMWIHFEPLQLERLTVGITNLPPNLVGTKLVQMSDFHYDQRSLSDNLLQQAIELSNQEMPDLVLLTGDYINYNPYPIYDLTLRLKTLESRLGIYACLGNHDSCYHPRAKKIVSEALNRIGIQVLWNEIATPFGVEFPLVGLADFWSKEFNPEAVFQRLDASIPRLVLSHNPDSAAVLKDWRVDLQLSGHTHGGQVVIPGLGSAPLLLQQLRPHISPSFHRWIPFLRKYSRVMKNWQWGQGWHQIGKNQLYVNRGLGSHFPGRFFCPPEVTVITLEGKCDLNPNSKTFRL